MFLCAFVLNFVKELKMLVSSIFSFVRKTRLGTFILICYPFIFFPQILRLFSESAESIKELKVDLAEAKRRLGTRNKQLHQLWYRSVTLRHIISLLDQIEGIAKVCLLLNSGTYSIDWSVMRFQDLTYTHTCTSQTWTRLHYSHCT